MSGNVDGTAVAVNDAASIIGRLEVSASMGTLVGVFLTNVAGTCGGLAGSFYPASSAVLSIVVGNSSPVGPGTYSVDGGRTMVEYSVQDSDCVPTTNEVAESGTVTYETVDGSTVAGSFDVTFPGGAHVSGKFSAPSCGADLNALLNQGSNLCGDAG